MKEQLFLRTALLAAALGVATARREAGASDFLATQVQYEATGGKSAVELTWNDPDSSPGNVTIQRGGTVIATVAGVSGANTYLAENVPAGQYLFSAEGTNGSLGSQTQSVIASHEDLFGNPSAVECNQQENQGDCEIIIDWETGVPPPGEYEVLLDGSYQFSQPAFPLGAVIPGASAGERCVTVVSTMVVTTPATQGRYRGEPVESCCTITCGATVCPSPESLTLAQSKYSAMPAENAITASWNLPPQGPYANGIKTLVRGIESGTIDGASTRTVFDGLTQGVYELAVQGDCGVPNGLSGKIFDIFSLKPESPHKNPVTGPITCESGPLVAQITASWTAGDPSTFIDVYLVQNGSRTFARTIPGEQLQVTLDGAQPGDRIELQFFAFVDDFYFGSEPVLCELAEAGNRFISGICNGAGEKPDISSAIFGLNYLFVGGRKPPCEQACRINEGASFDLSDMVYLLNYLFTGGAPPVRWGGSTPRCETAPEALCGESLPACEG